MAGQIAFLGNFVSCTKMEGLGGKNLDSFNERSRYSEVERKFENGCIGS